MLIVIALGGNALLKRGDPLRADLQRKNIKLAAQEIAKLAENHQVVICHGNGPQVGLLSLQSEAYTEVPPYPLDILDAESQGMIGYLIQQEVGNKLIEKDIVTLLTQIIVDKNDPAFNTPTKPIGPVYRKKEQAKAIAKKRHWQIAQDGNYWRRVVPSPQPKEIVELNIIKTLIKDKMMVICGGGGGIPVIKQPDGTLKGIEAVIDKDNTSALIAEKIGADALVILTDIEAVCENWQTPNEKKIKAISPSMLKTMKFAKGSMGPKVTATSRFVKNTGKFAAIGTLFKLKKILEKESGTQITNEVSETEYY